MSDGESKQDLFLKRLQVSIAILAGLATLVLGVYNVKKNMFTENSPGNIILNVTTDNQPLNGAYVQIFNSQNVLVNAALTRGNGEYGAKDLDAGSYGIKVTKNGFDPAFLTAQVNPKKTTTLDLILRPLFQPAPAVQAQAPGGSTIKSALEDAGASWIRKMSSQYTESKDKPAAQASLN